MYIYIYIYRERERERDVHIHIVGVLPLTCSGPGALRHRAEEQPGCRENEKGGMQKGGKNTATSNKETTAQKELDMSFPPFSPPPPLFILPRLARLR